MKAENKTKLKILHHIKLSGNISQRELAETLGITKMAISRQLNVLKEEELIDYKEVKQKVGRPILFYELTQKASVHFPNEHPTLSVSLIEAIKNCAGEDTLQSVLNYRLNAQLEDYQKQIKTEDPLDTKLKKLVKLRTNEGYMSQLTKVDEDNFIFTENNCPISTAAKNCTGLCENELALLQKVLGENISIERTEHIIDNKFKCSYQISSSFSS